MQKKIKKQQMLKQRQAEIADILLKELISENVVYVDYPVELGKYGYSEPETKIVIEILTNDYNLAYYHIEKLNNKTYYILTLTPEGNKAAKLGIEKYILKREKENRKSKTPIIISIIALFIAAIQPGIALYKLVWSENETENGHNKSYYGQNHTDSIIKLVLSDELFIEKLKDSLKHDTVFLNELKHETKTIDNQAPNR